MHAPVYDSQGNIVNDKKCAFCRAPWVSPNGEIYRLKKRAEAGDALAIHNLGIYYADGSHGFQQDYKHALESYHRVIDLGYVVAYSSIGNAYYNGEGVEVDRKMAIQYYELGAMGGDAYARHNLGFLDMKAGNMDRALKHYMIATRGGYNHSLGEIQGLYLDGDATKDDYTKALQLYQEYLGEIKSAQRDKAAALDKEHRYY